MLPADFFIFSSCQSSLGLSTSHVFFLTSSLLLILVFFSILIFRHSKTSITTRKLVRNWNSKWRIYFLNLVLPWNALFVQSNFNSQANLLCGQIQKCSGELKREIKLKLIDLKKIANEIVIVESSARNPFQVRKVVVIEKSIRKRDPKFNDICNRKTYIYVFFI